MAKPLKDLIADVLQQAAKTHEAIYQVQAHWEELVGKKLAAHTKPMTIKRDRLYVHADQPASSFSLSLERSKLLKRLPEIAGRPITDIVIRAGTVA